MSHEPIVRAIDVGFGNTKFVVRSSGGRISCRHFPSLAFFGLDDAIDGARRTVRIPVDGLYYEVGPDVELAADRFRFRHLHDGYTHTPEYRALAAGALHYMKVDRVDLLVVGLPVAQYLVRRAALEKAMTGAFDVGRRRHVVVHRALAVAQPQGALFEYAMSQPESLALGRSLVIDVGARTFDWLVTQGSRVVARMSSSVTRGVADVLAAIAERIGAELREEFRDVDAIDAALRHGKRLRIYQREYDLEPFDPLVQKIAEQAVLAMVQRMEATHGIENIVLVGGGAALFKKAIKKQFPKHALREVSDPMHANVRGFQLLGEQFVREHAEMFAKDDRAPVPSVPADVAAQTCADSNASTAGVEVGGVPGKDAP